MKTIFPKSAPREIEREIATFQRDFQKIMKHEGEFVLIHGDLVVSYHPTYGQAASEGYKRFRLDNFLVRQVRTGDTPIRAMRCGVIKHDGKLRLTRTQKR
jgi:hypothetical protein